MTLRRRITFGFAIAIISLTVCGAILISLLGRGPDNLGELHTPALYLSQEMTVHSEEAMERSYAYIVSGDTKIKQAYHDEMREFDETVGEWRRLEDRNGTYTDREDDILTSILARKHELQRTTATMFQEYENKGSVGPGTFLIHDSAIWKLNRSIDQLVAHQKRQVEQAHHAAIQLVQQSIIAIAGIGLFAILVSIILGRIISRTVSRPIAHLAAAADGLAGGDLDTPVAIESSDEIGRLAQSLDHMRSSLKDAFDDLKYQIVQREVAQKELSSSEGRFRSLFEHAPDAYFLSDSDGLFIDANRATEVLLEKDRNELRGLPLRKIGLSTDVDELILRRGAADVHLEISSMPLNLHGRDLILGIARDVTDRKDSEEALRHSEGRLRVLVEQMPTILWTTDSDFVFTSSEGLGLKTLGLAPNEVVGKKLCAFFGTDDPHSPAIRDHHRALEGESVIFETQLGDRFLSNYVEPLRDSGGNIVGTIGVATDVTVTKQAEETIKFLAHHDGLTGLPNRALFHDRLSHELAHARRKNERVAVILLDLDDFKSINDSLGHTAGDEFLIGVGHRLQGCTREDDTFARIGGDEFAAIQTDIQGASEPAAVAQRMIEALTAPILVGGHPLQTSCSIGIVVTDGDSEDIDKLLSQADMAMYQAKSQGRNRYRFFDEEMNRRVHDRLELEMDLREAILKNQLSLHYQPIINLKNGVVTRIEALLRWHHPVHGMIPPLSFIPIAESSELIVPIGEWVLRQACAHNQALRQLGLPAVKVAVNVSPVQLRQLDFVRMVKKVVEETHLNPAQLEFELTESLFVEDTESTFEALQALRVYGISISIDDFGTGYSSLNYLRRFPVDTLKIDRSFVTEVGTDEGVASIARAMIGLSTSLGLKCIAEGVETEAQMSFLSEHGCAEAQGFLFCRPRPAEELSEILQTTYRLKAFQNEELF